MQNNIKLIIILFTLNLTIIVGLSKILYDLQNRLIEVQTNLSKLELSNQQIEEKIVSTNLEVIDLINTKANIDSTQCLQTQDGSLWFIGAGLFLTITLFFLHSAHIQLTHVQTISSMEKCCNTQIDALNVINKNNLDIINYGSSQLNKLHNLQMTKLSTIETNIIDKLNEKLPENLDMINEAINTISNT